MNVNSTNRPSPPPMSSALLVSENQAENCWISDVDSIPSSSGSTRRRRLRRALDDRDVAADLHDQDDGAGIERGVVVTLGDQIDVAAAGNRDTDLPALPARDRQQQPPLAPDQRGRAAELSDGLARQRAERHRR